MCRHFKLKYRSGKRYLMDYYYKAASIKAPGLKFWSHVCLENTALAWQGIKKLFLFMNERMKKITKIIQINYFESINNNGGMKGEEEVEGKNKFLIHIWDVDLSFTRHNMMPGFHSASHSTLSIDMMLMLMMKKTMNRKNRTS